MKIKNSRFGTPDPNFIAGIDGNTKCPFSGIEFLSRTNGEETTLQRIASEEFDSIVDSVENTGLMPPIVIMNVISKCSNIERKHREELERLAIDTVAINFGLPKEIKEMLVAKLDTENDLDCTPGDDEESDNEELTEEELKVADELIKKRIVQNALMMGSGYRAHKLFNGIKESLDQIDEKLYPTYQTFMPSVEFYLWKQEIPVSGRVNWGKCEIIEENGEIKGKATAKSFIILLHEVAKIAVEIMFLQSLVDTSEKYGEKVKRYVINNADKYEDEQWMKLIGPRLWKHLHDCMDYIVKSREDDYTLVSYILNSIGVLYPKNFMSLMGLVINDGDKAVKFIEKMLDEILVEIEQYRRQESEDTVIPKSPQKKTSKKRVALSDYSTVELNKLLRDAVESEEFERASMIKKELDSRS